MLALALPLLALASAPDVLVDWRAELGLLGTGYDALEATFDDLGRQGMRFRGEAQAWARFERMDGASWEYRLVPEDVVGSTPERLEARLDALGAQGWRYRGTLDRVRVFERPASGALAVDYTVRTVTQLVGPFGWPSELPTAVAALGDDGWRYVDKLGSAYLFER